MSEIESRLEHLGISLPAEPVPIANYVPGVRTGNLLYLSGLGPASTGRRHYPFRQGGPRPDDRSRVTKRLGSPASTFWRA